MDALPAARAGQLVITSPERMHITLEDGTSIALFGPQAFSVASHGARLVCADGGHVPDGDQRCPTCGDAVWPSPRYPRLLCALCLHEATDEGGRALWFDNGGAGGGLRVRYRDTAQERRETLCWVRGVPCKAAEGYVGGVVIEPVR
ncbi:hypothetical protein [Chondromyces apiculatus]|uniref:ADP-ribosylation/Crystallin J1 n=1 Tax=Chondromyces apiculatus DSM 436 TaxID=1192034 RepID=A0A017SYW3_9BACT|nr:hypothetical protein [Chondromyces apiculatus]EYF01486.1 ADP-ribosylation/Crystallin J1 [Chondromyces apiculatus DSM 436]